MTVPLHRHYDVTREVDLIEEVGRLEGFDRLPRTLPTHAERVGALSREQSCCRRRAEDVLRDAGFDEVVDLVVRRPRARRRGCDSPRTTRARALSRPATRSPPSTS